MANTRSNVPKKNKKINFKSPVLILFLLIIIGLGVFIIFRSFASDGQLGTSKVLVTKIGEHLGVGDGELIQVRPTVPFVLYDNGLAVCGNYSETDTKHSLPYYSKTLTPQERDSFVASLVDTGFMNLKENYPDSVIDYNSISVASGGVANVVNVEEGYTGADATAYAKTDAIITGFCNGLNTAYEPEEVEVKTKITSPSMGKKGASAFEPELSIPTDNAIKTQNIKGATAKKQYKTHGKKGEKFSYSASGVIQTVVIPILPSAAPIAPTKNLPPKTSQNTLSPVVATANASKDPPLPSNFYRFCPKNKSCPNDYPTVNDMIRKVNQWYAYKVGAVFDIKNQDLLVGLHDEKWYISYQPAVAKVYGTKYNSKGTPDGYLFGNLSYELWVERGWKKNAPRIMKYQGTTGNTTNRAWCGEAAQPSMDDLYNGKGELGIVTSESPSPGLTCSQTDSTPMEFFFGTTAHELGHTQALWHTYGNTVPQIMSYSIMCLNLDNCGIDPWGRIVVRGYSPFVKLVK